ncbi:MAG: hypothetical protein AVDCRST_MAG39-367 [uncultured Sphingomonadaceae bacterium]|uniref:PhnA-like protein n=1 Tax=uncultured Sphingomonadaceae bacterium TaxID=169976 RepID=A0A6J4RZT2_9SPHN|nr:MAG: hypothetical protein AVDCRST_MAG39-367 [uncultured Sphingomonadaceae bacterium]
MDQHPDTPRNRGDLDAPHMTPVTPSEDIRTIAINDIDWGAVFAGAVVALVLQLLLNMFGLGLGLGTVDPGTADGSPSAGALGLGAAIWFVLSGIIASFVGGIAAGRLSGKPREDTGAWHGLVAWAVTTLGVVYLLTTAVSGIVGGTLGAVGGIARGAATTVGGAVQTAAVAAPAAAGEDGVDVAGAVNSVQQQVNEATGGQDPGQLLNTVRAYTSGDPAQQAQAREQAAVTIAQQRGLSIEQARAEVARLEAQTRGQVQQTTQKVAKTADAAAGAASKGSILAALGLVLGALAAWFGGRRGAVHPTVTGLRGTAAGTGGNRGIRVS